MNRREFMTSTTGTVLLSGASRPAPQAPVTSGDPGSYLSLTTAVVVCPEDFSGPESKAVGMLVEEVEKRTQIRWPTAHRAFSSPAILVTGLRKN